MLQSEMEEKDTAIALLEISDGCHGHREEIVELQEQRNILMKMIKRHVSGHDCVCLSFVILCGSICLLNIPRLKHLIKGMLTFSANVL